MGSQSQEWCRDEVIADYEKYCRWMAGDDFNVQWFHEFVIDQIKESIDRSIMGDSSAKSFLMPPRHGKTQLAGRYFMTYMFGRFPDKKILYATYNEQQAKDIKDEIEVMLNSQEYLAIFPKSRTRDNSDIYEIDKSVRKTIKNTAFKISNTSSLTGSITFVGRGSSTTGKGYDIVIIDDPYKDMAEALSQQVNKGIWRWYLASVDNRTDTGSAINVAGSIIFMFYTRWSSKDIIGKLLDYNKSNIDPHYVPLEVFKFSAERQDDDLWYDKRNEGEPLDPSKIHKYAIQKKDPEIWMASYQQNPIDEFGAMFQLQWMSRFVSTAYLKQILIVVDANYKEKSKTVDRTGIIVFGTLNRRYYPIEIINKKMDYPELLCVVSMLAKKYPYWAIVIEDKANGTALIPDMRQKFSRVVGVEPKGKSKRERAQLILPIVQGGGLLLPDISLCHNVTELITQLMTFSGNEGEQDDLVDCVIYALSYYEEFGAYLGQEVIKMVGDKVAQKYLPPATRIAITGPSRNKQGLLGGMRRGI